ELAAVMGHEIVHAAARHGAQGMERGMLLQGAMIAVGIGAQNTDYSQLIVGGAQVGAQLVNSKYGRDAESESDLYGMQYMKKAGYDPAAAVTLQETFVRLSEGRQSNFIEGLFASHPPSPERVAANKATLAKIGAGGEWGKEIYAQKTAKLRATRGAYKAYDEAVKALGEKNADKAKTLINQAIAIEPKEARFQELLGDIALTQQKPQEALAFYDKAIKMQPDYFKPHIQSGIALFNMGKKTEAEPYLKRANALLPTAPGHALLGQLSEERGDINGALQHYQVAASSNSDIGKQAVARAVKLDLPRNPAKYIQAAAQADNSGNLYAVVQNGTPVALKRVVVRMVKYDARTGAAVGQSGLLTINGVAAGKRNQVAVGARVNNAKEVGLYKVVVESAELAQ
ncbi:MAG: M48 family metalloprotease, partial [Methylotenera sp.]